MNSPRVLVAGIGNIFLGDDAFGVELAWRLARRPLPERVRVVDFGIRGIDLAYTLLDGCEAVILLDAAPRGGAPGTLYVLELEPISPFQPIGEPAAGAAHEMHPARVLQLAAALGSDVRRVLLVGCEPGPVDESQIAAGLSPAVAAAVDRAVPLVEDLVARLLGGEPVGPCEPRGECSDSSPDGVV